MSYQSGTTLAARTEKMIEKKTTWTTATLKDLADLFGLEKSGDRVSRIIQVKESSFETVDEGL